jgi:hypothetical protein
MDDVLDAIGMRGCEHVDHVAFEKRKIEGDNTDADLKSANGTAIDNWVTPKGWDVLY